MLLNYQQYSEQGEPLLILHGLFGNLGNWGWHSKQLAETFAVYGVDLRNHGDSPHEDDMSFAAMAEDVKQLLDHLGIASCYIIGHSMGGKVAMQLALTYPDVVAKLVVVDIAPVAYGGSAEEHLNAIAGMQAMDLDNLRSRAEADRQLAQFIADESTRKFMLTNLARDDGGYRWRLNLTAIKEHYDRLRERPVGESVFEKPTLFVKGDLSGYIQEKHKEQILELFPNAAIKVVMEAGHWLHADKPQAFQKIAMDFLTQD